MGGAALCQRARAHYFCDSLPRGIFEVEFDFLASQLVIQTSQGSAKTIPLAPRSVADFYKEFMAALAIVGIEVKIWHMPVEIPNPIAFDRDTQHASYDREYVTRFWRILLVVDSIFEEFRSRFIGKNSPVHFFWGSFDLASRGFPDDRAPEREGADPITREAYSHEVISAGFWPGGGDMKGPRFTPTRRRSPRVRTEPRCVPARRFITRK